MPTGPILVISGTNRPGSNAMKIANQLMAHYRSCDAPTELYSLTEMPAELFKGDAYATKPASFVAVQNKVVHARGLHLVTPEYNGSFPGVLKYFIDMLKFPDSFERKPVAFTGEAAGLWGALRSVEQLQMIFSYRNAYVYPDRVFIPGVNSKLDASGGLTDTSIDDRLRAQCEGFGEFCARFA